MTHAPAALRLEPADEFCHELEEASNFNESMYANVLDGRGGLGVWLRVGNRPNEGHAEVSCCVYLPDGRVGFMFARPECRTNDTLAAGGAAFEVLEPFERVRMTYDGLLCLLDEPRQMADPKQAFVSNPIVACTVDVELRGLVTPYGGEPEDPAADSPLTSFARGHYEQHVRGTGSVTVDGTTYPLEGLGLRDHSWGPRYWQNLSWYRFLPLIFSPDFAMCPVLIGDDSGGLHAGGMVLRVGEEGERGYVSIEDVSFTTTYDDEDFPVAQRVDVRTAERSYVVEGTSLSMIPLRNRRGAGATRITEAMTRFVCDGLEGVGMSEYLDQIVDGRPTGRHV